MPNVVFAGQFCFMNRECKSVSVAIVGGGIAGLACAGALSRGGYRVTVFDKSRGVGGRMSTRRGDGWQCDHGVPYFLARDSEFVSEVARWMAAGAVAPWHARVVSMAPDVPPMAAPPMTRYVGVPTMTMPARLLSMGAKTVTATTVDALFREAGSWQLSSAEGGLIGDQFDIVVVGVPSPQAVPLLEGTASDFALAASRARMRPIWVVMAQCETNADLSFDAAVVNGAPLAWIANDTSKPGRTGYCTWALHASSAWTDAHLEDAPEDVARTLVAAFRELGGPAVRAATAHRWRYAEPLEPKGDDAPGYMWRMQDGIGICGDWLAGGGVEGAWLSGNRLGEAIRRSRTSQACGPRAAAHVAAQSS
jgi:predicted NAD/FAD-dependent oxidoreductase